MSIQAVDDDNFNLQQVKFGADTLPSHPHRVYKMETHDLEKSTCHERLCSKQAGFVWYSEMGCHSHFMCTKLDGNICGNFWVNIAKVNSSAVVSVCQENVIYRNQLASTEPLAVQLLYTKEARFDLVCYIWCAADGENGLPIEKPLGNSERPPIEDISLRVVVQYPDKTFINQSIIHDSLKV